ncbi:MAG: radical SAM protein [Candidatus Woesearchaeota archaeon]
MISKKIAGYVPWQLVSALDFGGWITKPSRYLLGLSKFRITCLQVHITSNCNLNCSYCYAKNHKGKSLSDNTILSLIRQAKENGVHEIQFVGGEPLLHPKLKDFVKLTASLGMNMRIYTNATLLNGDWMNFFQRFRDKLVFAIKFDSKTGYKKQVGRDLFSRIVKALELCKSSNVPANTFITVTRKNFDQVEGLINKSFELKAPPIIERYLPTCSQELNKSLGVSASQWKHVLHLFNKYYKDNLAFYNVTSRMLNFYCSCYNSTLSIDTNGEALPCPYAPKDLTLGNVTKKQLSDLIYLYSQKVAEWNRLPEECNSCKSKSLCTGGCKTYAFLKNKRLDIRDGLCKENIPPTLTMCSFNNSLIK